MKFTELELVPEILRGIGDAGFVECTLVQEETFGHSFNGKDVCVQSQTGTGKTAAYLVTIFKLFTDNLVPTKKALIMVPTRELAVQIEKETKLLGGDYLGLKSATFFGGVGYGPQEDALAKGVDIMIATPGRLIDLYKSGKVKLNDISVLVIDEADRMFDMGFIPDIRYLIKKMPGSKNRRTMLFSATLSQKVKGLAWEYMNDPAEVEIMPESITVENITQSIYHVGSDEKFRLLLGLLKKHNPNNAIIFTNMKRTAEIISKKLTANGYPNEYIMGDLPQKKRLRVIEGVKKGEIKFLVATDVAARGLHVDDLDMVFNYDIPEDCENYVHRIGRTARAGKSGIAVSLACEKYVQGLEGIESFISMKIPVEWHGEELLVEDISRGMRFERDHDVRRRDRGDRGERRGGRGEKRSERRPSHEHRGEQRKERTPHRDHDVTRRERPVHARTDRDDGMKRTAISERPTHTRTDQHAKSGQQRADQRHPQKSGRPHERRPQEVKRNERRPHDAGKSKTHHYEKRITPRRDGTIEERIAYYRQKYGDNFRVTEEMLRDERSSKKTLLQKIKGIFEKK
jgi:ATP-dependent RNA helicase RhlB